MSALFGWLDSPIGVKDVATAGGSVREMTGIADLFRDDYVVEALDPNIAASGDSIVIGAARLARISST
jgi:cobalamin biosynthesis protein CbiG